MAYHVTKDLKAEVKVSGSLFLKDLLTLSGKKSPTSKVVG